MRGKRVYRPRRVFCPSSKASPRGGEKAGKKEGRPPTYSDDLYLVLLILRSYCNLIYRETEAFFRDLFPDQSGPSFQALHWCMRKKLGEEEFHQLLGACEEEAPPFSREEPPLHPRGHGNSSAGQSART